MRHHLQVSPGVEFVPMIWSDAFISATDSINQTGARVLLGFNEPNNCYDGNQACMTPAFAASLWPRLQVGRGWGGVHARV